jgi:hypothetical protein
VAALLAKHGEALGPRIRLGVTQVAARWWPEDGDAQAFHTFVTEGFLPTVTDLDAMAERLERVQEQIEGHLHEVARLVTEPSQLDTGPVRAWDQLLGDLSLASHVTPDLFANKVAFLALLNFPVHTLAERLASGSTWDRATWARSRMMDRFAARVPADVSQEVTRAFNAAEQYIADYNVYMGQLVAEDGSKPFPAGLKLITHWGLRDELKSHYGEGEAGLRKQRLIAKVMERIVRQEVPACTINADGVAWAPFKDAGQPCPPEPDTRYARILDVFQAVRKVDPYNPTAPTFIQARFEQDRQIPEAEVEALLASILESQEVRDIAKLVQARVGRPLEPFDIWYSGFKPGRGRSEEELDRIVARKYPTVAAFQGDVPRILRALGFAPDKADWLAAHITVDPSRGAGHAMGAVPARGQGAPADADPRRGDELQGLQHRHPRDGTQRRAGLLAQRDRPLVPERGPQQRLHGGAGLRLPGARPGAAGPGIPQRGGAPPGRRWTTCGAPTRSAGWRSWTCACGAGCTPTRKRARGS